MASSLSSFLISNGATDTRYGGGQAKPDKDARPGAAPEQLDRQGRRIRPITPQEAAKPEAQPQQAARPDADGLSSQGEPGRPGRNARRLGRPGEAPDAGKPTAEGQAPAPAAGNERGPDGRKLTAKQRLGKRGKPGSEELPKTDAAKGEPTKDEKPAAKPPRTRAADPRASSRPGRPDLNRRNPKLPSLNLPSLNLPGLNPPRSTRRKRPAVVKPRDGGPIRFLPLRRHRLLPVAHWERTPAPPAAAAPPAPTAAMPPAAAASPPAPAPAAVTASVPQPEPAAPAGPPVPPISK